jgi:hypothetical protein
MQAQYMAFTQAMKDALWLIRFLGEEKYKHEKPTLNFIDFQWNLMLLKNLMHHSCIKHIDI